MSIIKREWVRTESSAEAKGSICIMQWNVLAEGNCDDSPQGFPNVSAESRDVEKRRVLQVQTFSDIRADIIALEEVQVESYEFYKSVLESQGFEVCRTFNHSKTYQNAIAWRRSRVGCYHTNQLDLGHNGVAIRAYLKCAGVGFIKAFVVHLKAKPNFAKERCEQMEKLFEYIDSDKSPFFHTIILGDFNDVPDSEVVKMTTRKREDKRSFKSAYDLNSPSLYTTFKYRPASGLLKRTIDYIMVEDDFQVFELLSIPDPGEFPDVGLPSPNYPSDHLAIGAVIGFI